MSEDVTEMYDILTDAFMGFLAKLDGLFGDMGVGIKGEDVHVCQL